MVGRPWWALIALAGASLMACKEPAATADLCFSTRAGMGQSLQTLYCGKDSCYLIVFAANTPRPASVGLFGGPISRDSLARGDALVQAFLQRKEPPVPHRSSSSFMVERNGVEISMPRQPETETFIAEMKAWVQNRKEELRALPPIWRDSLVLRQVEGKSREIEIRLESGATYGGMLGNPMSLTLLQAFSQSGGSEQQATRVQLSLDSIAPILTAKGALYRVPMGVDTLEAVFKIYSRQGAPPLPNACLEGVFELRAEPQRVD